MNDSGTNFFLRYLALFTYFVVQFMFSYFIILASKTIMEPKDKKFKLLSVSSVSRLSYDAQIRYFHDLVDNIDSDEEEMAADVTPPVSTDESNIPIIYEEVENEASDVETTSYPVELGHGGDSDNENEVEEEEADTDMTVREEINYFVAKDGTSWSKYPPKFHRMRRQNIFRENRFVGPNPTTKNLGIMDTFNAIMHPTITSIICRNTNKKARDIYDELEKTRTPTTRRSVWEEINDEELSAFFGVLIAMGIHNANNERLEALWQSNAFPLYRATMSGKRFVNIARFIRFDQQNTRETRSLTDKAAPISEIFEMLNANLRQNYRPGENITVDEQLFPFRGRTKFTQYIPSKPAKYGIKLWWVCDAKSYYPLTGQIYTGKTGNNREMNQGERVVKDLVQQYKNSGRNVTCDNFFTSLPLADTLATWGLSLVGTMKKNKSCIPSEFKASPQRPEHSTLFGYGENRTICSYVSKKNKSVILLSTMPCDNTISDIKQKPNIILFYNQTKGGVDVMDHMLGQYTTKRQTKRWPLALFYNILDISALAAFIIYSENNPSHFTLKRGARRLFLQKLAEQLCMPMILKRAKIPRVVSFFPTKNAIECILGAPIHSLTSSTQDDFVPDEDDRGHSKKVHAKLVTESKTYPNRIRNAQLIAISKSKYLQIKGIFHKKPQRQTARKNEKNETGEKNRLLSRECINFVCGGICGQHMMH
ncbi:PiggyBac transposable element-derived protein 4 [Lucilia cuprina]|nr:PiggyBac transposable element-derived protein 4 [Lucilia cuprina]